MTQIIKEKIRKYKKEITLKKNIEKSKTQVILI